MGVRRGVGIKPATLTCKAARRWAGGRVIGWAARGVQVNLPIPLFNVMSGYGLALLDRLVVNQANGAREREKERQGEGEGEGGREVKGRGRGWGRRRGKGKEGGRGGGRGGGGVNTA